MLTKCVSLRAVSIIITVIAAAGIMALGKRQEEE